MKCKRCNQELKDNAMFCVHCGEKTSNKIANYLRVTGIVDVILTGIGIITSLVMIGETVKMSGAAYVIWGMLVNIFTLYVAVMVIKNSHNFEMALHLKKLAIAYLIVTIITSLIAIPVTMAGLGDTGGMDGLVGASVAWGVIGSCIIPTLYIIFTSKIEQMYLSQKDD